MSRREGKCPACGALVTVDDEAQSVVHDDPVCEPFDTAARSGSEQPEVRTVNAEAVGAHLDALRRRVEAKK
jgi:hypothetical protein